MEKISIPAMTSTHTDSPAFIVNGSAEYAFAQTASELSVNSSAGSENRALISAAGIREISSPLIGTAPPDTAAACIITQTPPKLSAAAHSGTAPTAGTRSLTRVTSSSAGNTLPEFPPSPAALSSFSISPVTPELSNSAVTAANAAAIMQTVYITLAPLSTDRTKHSTPRSVCASLPVSVIRSPVRQTATAITSDDSKHAPYITPPTAALRNTTIPAVPITNDGPLP